MRGLELSRGYYKEYGRPMLEKEFPELLSFLAVGLFGQGSECFGYDDDVSRDHDFDHGFCILLPGEDIVDRRTAFRLERAYGRLPREYMGIVRERLSPVGGARRGVLRTGEVFLDLVGASDGELTAEQWLTVPEQGLAEATNGCIFSDPYGEVSGIRKKLAYYPEDIRLKKLAGNLLLMAQTGLYNYSRCIAHGELAAAQLAVFGFVDSFMSAAFLLNRRYQPFYKWRFRAFRELPYLSEHAEELENLLTTDNHAKMAEQKRDTMENLSARLIRELQREHELRGDCTDLEATAYAVNDCIRDGMLRSMHILAGV